MNSGMNDVVVSGSTARSDEGGLRLLTHILYGLHTLSCSRPACSR